jgi:DNA-binding transcriptional LysR family regulator
MVRINLDMDVLRTLVATYQLGSFNRAAERVGRSQSAISQQIHKLEERVGQPLFRKQGRGLALTEAGEVVLAYAHRILDLNDEAVTAVTGVAIDGAVRFWNAWRFRGNMVAGGAWPLQARASDCPHISLVSD